MLSNVVTFIEQHVGFIARALEYARAERSEHIEAEVEKEDHRVTTADDLANLTIYRRVDVLVPGCQR